MKGPVQHPPPPVAQTEPSFCLELDYDEFPQSDAEYLALLHAKIAEAHERQLLPLKEDVADWLAKLLDEEDLCHTNLLDRLGTGVLLCRLADIVSRKAQDARQMGISQLEVPRLPYKTWERARQGSFFARDNISNFLRFCRRLGVHDNLLFETEDLVNGHGARTIVLCLLEVGRLAQNWWGLEPPAIVKLEKEMEGEEWSARSDSGYSNASSPHGSTLALNPPLSTSPVMPPSSEGAKSPRPRSAPSHLPLGARLSLPSNTLDSAESTSSSDTRETTDSGSEFKVPRTAIQNKKAATAPSGSPRAPKPTPPPKPASIRRAVNSITSGASGTTRPSSLGSSIPTPSRGWSGSKTTPCTPVTTPTHTPRTRLPIARTPRTSGRSTPNTTPTTPTQCRRYLASAKKTPSKIPCRTPTSTRTPTTGSGSAVRNTAAFITPSHGRPPVTPVSASRSAHCNRTKEDNRQLNRDLDNRVQDIARQTRGVCTCVEPSCNRTHIKKLSDGKYDVYGKSVYVRLLKDKHVMVRVGGGWDTLEHYVLSHDPTQVTMFNSRGSEPFLHIRSRYRSPTPTKNISRSVQHLSKRHVSGGGVGNKSLMNDTFVVPPQPDFDTSFGSSQSLSDGSSSQSELMDQTAGGVLIPEGDDDGGQQIMSAIESLSRSMGSPSTTRGFSPNASNGNGEAAHSSSQLATLEESPTDPSSTRIDNNNGDHSEPSASAAGEDLLSPCPCEIVPPIGAVTASCPPDVLAVSLTDSTISHSLDSTQSETTASSSANTVMLTQASMSDSMSSATLQEEADNTRMADSISSMERSQELGES